MDNKWCLEVSECLGEIKTKVDETQKTMQEVKETIKPLPEMRVKLKNHLTYHSNIRKYLFYPLLVATLIGLGGLAFSFIITH